MNAPYAAAEHSVHVRTARPLERPRLIAPGRSQVGTAKRAASRPESNGIFDPRTRRGNPNEDWTSTCESLALEVCRTEHHRSALLRPRSSYPTEVDYPPRRHLPSPDPPLHPAGVATARRSPRRLLSPVWCAFSSPFHLRLEDVKPQYRSPPSRSQWTPRQPDSRLWGLPPACRFIACL